MLNHDFPVYLTFVELQCLLIIFYSSPSTAFTGQTEGRAQHVRTKVPAALVGGYYDIPKLVNSFYTSKQQITI